MGEIIVFLLLIEIQASCALNFLYLQLDVYDEDISSRNDLIGSTILSLTDMLGLATSGSSVELYKKAKYRGMLFIAQCEVEQPVDMVCKDGKQGYVSSYPPRKQLQISQSLPAYWQAKRRNPPTPNQIPNHPYQLPNPSYPNHPPHNITLRSSKIPSNYQASFQPQLVSTPTPPPSYQHARTMSNPEGMAQGQPSKSILRKVSEGVSKLNLGSEDKNLQALGKMRKDSLGSFGSMVNNATKTTAGWSIVDQLDKITKKQLVDQICFNLHGN